MPNQNQTNQPNNPQFNQNPNVADKHMQFVNQVQPQQNQQAVPLQQPQRTVPTQPQAPVQQVPQQQPAQYINPNNFQQVLGQQPQQRQQSTNAQSPVGAMPQPAQPASQLNPDAPIQPLQVQYSETVMKPAAQKDADKHEVMRLVIYAVPLFAMFILLLKSIEDEGVMWHVRQSLLTQAVWFSILIVLSLLDLPIISTYGLNLWNIACYALLIVAGAQAYSNQKFLIPVVYEAGKSFIDGGK
jgi:uncharacterized membrane protein